MRSEAFYRNAAKAAWVAPLIAIAVNYANSPPPKEPHVRLVNGWICFGLILTGLVCGILALRGTATYRRASILVPAIIGVSFNGLVIIALLAVIHLAGKVSTASAAMRQQQQQQRLRAEMDEGAREGRQSITEYGGWVGRITTPSAAIGVTSLDDRSPMARRILDDLPVSCSIVVIAARPAPSHDGVRLEPSSLTMELADGSTLHALDGRSILSRAKDDPNGALLRFNAACRADPTQNAYEALALIPAGTDLHDLRSVTLRVNGKPIKVPGRFMTAEERRTSLENAPSK